MTMVYGPIDMDYLSDMRRGRFSDHGDRFFRIYAFARKRWEASRDLRYASRWLKTMSIVKRRSPRGIVG